MKTITIQIGNTDDKLTQAEWSAFVSLMKEAVSKYSGAVHFFGASSNWEKWQNAAWVVTCDSYSQVEALRAAVKQARELFGQDSAAWTEGETIFV